MAEGSKRYRNFATVVYPESAPEHWKGILADELIPAFISPLHDQDINPTGEAKKPHYHVLLMFDGVKTIEQVKETVNKISGVGCEVVKSLRSYARYLCHMDNPDKYQYPVDEVDSFGGADFVGICGSAVDRYKAIGEMIDFCIDNDIRSYSKLLIYCRSERSDWFRILCDSGTVVMREFIKSHYWAQVRGHDPYEVDSNEQRTVF